VTSLIESFTKPFLVGGLKRKRQMSAGTVIGTVASLVNRDQTALVSHDEDEERVDQVGSPDWPDSNEEPQLTEKPPYRGRSPDRSPGLSPDARALVDGEFATIGMVWKDPLEEDDDEDDDDYDGRLSPPSRKMQKT
jgi:DNA excision repair protein ERCC-1